MKKSLLLAVLCIFCDHSIGQNYYPLPSPDATWSVADFSFGLLSQVEKLSLNGDTTIQNETYKKIRYESYLVDLNENILFDTAFYLGGIMEANRKWYFIPYYDDTAKLLYDFDVAVGDTIVFFIYKDFTTPRHVVVDSVDSVFIYMNSRLRLHVSNSTGYTATWISGIGSDHGLLYPIQTSTDIEDRLTCFWENGTILYFDSVHQDHCELYPTGIKETQSFFSLAVFPNPVNSQTSLHVSWPDFDLQNVTLLLFDITGKSISIKPNLLQNSIKLSMSKFPAGLYQLQLRCDGKIIGNSKIIMH